MSFGFSLGVIIGCVCGVFSTVTLVGLAFAVRNKQLNSEQEETDKYE